MDVGKRTLVRQGDIWVIAKPPGIPTSGRNLHDPDCVQTHLIRDHNSMVWAVHQLDADTSGVNLFVTDKREVRRFQREWSQPSTLKIYVAIVHGQFPVGKTDCLEPIGWVDERNLGISPHGKSAHTHFLHLATTGEFSLIAARLWTGRTHQIRIHAAHLGHRLVGEEWYGGEPCNHHARQALHAIFFQNSEWGLYCPLEPDLADLAKRLGLPIPVEEEIRHLFASGDSVAPGSGLG